MSDLTAFFTGATAIFTGLAALVSARALKVSRLTFQRSILLPRWRFTATSPGSATVASKLESWTDKREHFTVHTTLLNAGRGDAFEVEVTDHNGYVEQLGADGEWQKNVIMPVLRKGDSVRLRFGFYLSSGEESRIRVLWLEEGRTTGELEARERSFGWREFAPVRN